jgi:hypothetical protein
MALGLMGGFLYYSQLDFSSDVPPLEQRHQMASMKGLESLKIDYRILKNEEFQQLKIFGQTTVKPQVSGKDNPFQ